MMDSIFGRPGAMCMAAAIMISTFGCNNGLILSGARVYYAMARDRLFFKKVGTTNRFHVPAAALVARESGRRSDFATHGDTRPHDTPGQFMEMFTTNCSNTSSQRICFFTF